MLALYTKLVLEGIRTIESIPADFKEEVRAAVEVSKNTVE